MLRAQKAAGNPQEVVKGIWREGRQAALEEFDSLWKDPLAKINKEGSYQAKLRWKFIHDEHRALSEALTIAWYLRELPRLIQRFKILAVEKELSFPLVALRRKNITHKVIFESRAEAILKDRNDSANYIYSLKTAKDFDRFISDQYKIDLQCATETYSASRVVGDALDKPFPVNGVRFCFPLKGRKQGMNIGSYDDPIEIWSHQNPLIRGYRKIVAGKMQYAHSWKNPNPANKSGYGILGKGWEQFDVWKEFEGGVLGWIKLLAKGAQGTIQPQCGDIVGKYIVTPPEYFTYNPEVEELVTSLRGQEMVNIEAIEDIKEISKKYQFDDPGSVLRLEAIWLRFPQHRNACVYPGRCEMYDICHKPEVAQDPIGSGLYKYRVPHHKREKADMLDRFEGDEI